MTNFVGTSLTQVCNKNDNVTNKKALKRYGSSVEDDDECPENKKCYRKFSVGYSTERHFRIADDEEPAFYGAYGHVRKQLDHTYHEHYRKERQFVHDSIIEDYLEAAEENESENSLANHTSWLILTVGVKGAGKHYVIRELVDSGHLPLESYVLVDMDDLRRQLPEYDWYLQHAPDIVGDMTRGEARYIAETLCLAGLRMGKTVVWDCGLGDVEWYISRIQELRNTFPCLKVALMHVTATPEEIHKRCEKHSEVTGRTIPKSLVDETIARLPAYVERIRNEIEFDFWCHVENNADLLELNGDQDFQVFSGPAPTPSNCHRRSSKLSRVSLDLGDVNDDASSKRTSFRVSRESIPVSEDEQNLDHYRRLRRPSRRHFNCLQSSEENHKSNDMKFYGRFAHIRQSLDYMYHSNYTFERQRFQDNIIVEFLKAAIIHDKHGEVCTTPSEPWLCFTAGPMGAGKSYTMRKLVDKGRFPLLAFVNVDPDEIRRQLPEYHLYINHSPELAGELTRKEAGFIAEILTLAGLEAGKNVLVDGSLRDAEWYQHYIERLRKDFPNVKIAIIQVSAPREAVFQRAADRAKTTGRVVPQHLLEQALEQVPKSVKILAPLVDYHVELMNAPEAEDIEIVTPGETWESFKSQWIQTCAWIPRKHSQANLRRIESSISRAESSASDSIN